METTYHLTIPLFTIGRKRIKVFGPDRKLVGSGIKHTQLFEEITLFKANDKTILYQAAVPENQYERPAFFISDINQVFGNISRNLNRKGEVIGEWLIHDQGGNPVARAVPTGRGNYDFISQQGLVMGQLKQHSGAGKHYTCTYQEEAMTLMNQALLIMAPTLLVLI